MVRFAAQSTDAADFSPTSGLFGDPPAVDQSWLAPGSGSSQLPPLGRPYADTGKMSTNLMGPDTSQFQIGLSPQPPAAPADRFFSGMFQTLFGMTGNQDIANIGRSVGGLIDTPLEIAGQALNLPVTLLTSGAYLMSRNGQPLDPEVQALWNQKVASNPLAGLFSLGDIARRQWQDDVQAGRRSAILRDIGPSTNIGETLGTLMSLLSIPQRAVARTIAGATGKEEGVISTPSAQITNPVYADLQKRYYNGEFGEIGSKEARDRLLDELVMQGQFMRSQTTTPGGDLFGEIPNLFGDVVGAALTDPLILGDFGVSVLAKGADLGRAATAAKFLNVFPEADRAVVLAKVIDRIAENSGVVRDTAKYLFDTAPAVRERALLDVAKEYPAQLAEAQHAVGAMKEFATKVEPAMRPIIDIVHRINDPISLFGRGAAGKAAIGVFDQHATEGVIRGLGVDAVINIQRDLGRLGGDALDRFNEGLGVFTANEGRFALRHDFVRDAKRLGGLPLAYEPTEVIATGLKAMRSTDIAQMLERQVRRVKPLFLPLGRGPEALAEAVARARDEAVARLMKISDGIDEATARQLVSRMGPDGIAAVDAAAFGSAAREFVKVRELTKGTSAIPALDPAKLTIIGKRELTAQRAKAVLEAIRAGDAAAVRKAVQDYDLLFTNFAEASLNDRKLLNNVRDLIEASMDGLPKEIDMTDKVIAGLPPAMVQWAQKWGDIGYTLGFQPQGDATWRALMKDGKLVGVNPWIELTDEAAAVPSWGRFDAAKERFFHEIRGERIVLEARHRFARHMAMSTGLARADSDRLFSMIIKEASDEGITPRGMGPDQIWRVFQRANVSQINENLTKREAIEALLLSFEGNFWSVGSAQKFTGVVKTAFGMEHNFFGQLAERIYPTVRFTLNPIFQAQELVEPFILNIMRGIKPGIKESDLDKETLTLLHTLVQASTHEMDDQIERGNDLLLGTLATRQGFGPATRMGRLTKKLTLGDYINIKRMKQINYARATRKAFGEELHDTLTRISPSMIPELEAHYGTNNWGTIAVRYMTEKAQWSEGSRLAQDAAMAAAKPTTLGALDPIHLPHVVTHFDEATSVNDLRTMVRDGSISETRFRQVLTDVGADPAYVDRALSVARMPFTTDEYWKAWQDTVARGSAKQATMDRAFVKAHARAMGITEEEWLARRMADVPMSADAADFVGLTQRDRQSLELQARNRDRVLHALPSDPAELNRALNEEAINPPEYIVRSAPAQAKADALQMVTFKDNAHFPIHLPGGRERLMTGSPYTYWEQSLIKSQALDPGALWRADRELTLRLYQKGIWPSKNKTFDNLTDVYNGTLLAVLSPRTDLTINEGAATRLRAVVDPAAADRALNEELIPMARRVGDALPEEYRNDPSHLGMAYQILQGHYMFNLDRLDRIVDLAEEDRVTFQRVGAVVDRIIGDAVETGASVPAAVAQINRVLSKYDSRLMAHPWTIDGGSYVTFAPQGLIHKSSSTNQGWGNAVRWLRDIYDNPDDSVRRFLLQQPGEDRTAYGMRLSAILPGISAKTGLFSMDSGGPGLVSSGILDTITVRDLIRYAKSTDNDFNDYLAERLSPQYLAHINEQYAADVGRRVRLAAVGDETKRAKTSYNSPEPQQIRLLSGGRQKYYDNPTEAIRQARAGLVQIEDPALRDLLDNDAVLALNLRMNDGVVNVMGGDYAVLNDYLTKMKLDEARDFGYEGEGVVRTGDVAVTNVKFHRATVEEFDKAITEARKVEKNGRLVGETVYQYTPEEYADMALILSEDGKTGYALKQDGDLVSVFNVGGSGRGADAVWHGVRSGAVKLDAFDEGGFLPRLYGGFDFREVQREHWNPAYAPEIWRGGEPDVVYMNRAFGSNIAHLTNAEYQWLRWERERGILDPHLIMTTGIEPVPRLPDETLWDSVETLKSQGFVDQTGTRLTQGHAASPSHALLLQQRNGEVMGANVILDDQRRIIVATQSADRTTGTHELAHAFAGDLDPSQRGVVVAEFNKATGGRVRTWTTDVNEWFVNQFHGYLATGRAPVKELRPAFEYFRKWLARIWAHLKQTKQTVSPEMKGLFDSLFKPGESPVKASALAGIDLGQRFNLQEEMVYRAARADLVRAEENAFRLHYYKRGRNIIERSLNHPYFGLYPSSYMWGKILPEMIRFLVKEPFGIPAPFGGVLLSNSVMRSIMVQKATDPGLRQQMANSEPMFRFISMLVPAFPWEIPVNAPLWMRRLAEAGETNAYKVQRGQPPGKAMTPAQLGKMGADVMTYAFGPAYALSEGGKAIGAFTDLSDTIFNDVQSQLQGVFNGNPGPPVAEIPFQTGLSGG